MTLVLTDLSNIRSYKQHNFMIIIYTTIVYLSLGAMFSIPFLVTWIHRLHEATHESGLAFKLMILPGCIIFWPVLLKKYWKSNSAKP